MENNILGGLVIFVVVVTCLLMLDDITYVKHDQIVNANNNVEQVDQSKDLAIVETEEKHKIDFKEPHLSGYFEVTCNKS